MELVKVEKRLAHIEHDPKTLGVAYGKFLDVLGTSTARGTFYESDDELARVECELHDEMFGVDRGLYGLGLAFPGVLDRGRMMGTHRLLVSPSNGEVALLTQQEETALVRYMVATLPIHRQLKLFRGLKEGRVNNARTRKLILDICLNEINAFQSVKYRGLIQDALMHAWGVRQTGILRSILAHLNSWTEKEEAIVRTLIKRYTGLNRAGLYEMLAFVLGADLKFQRDLYAQFYRAREKLSDGAGLPVEVLEGIRSTYHPDVDPAVVLELTQKTMTARQKLDRQRSAKKRGVEIEFDPLKQDAVRLYVYGYETGEFTPGMIGALGIKAQKAAESLPFRFDKVGLVLDMSYSMRGDETQKWQPIAVASATRDVLLAASNTFAVSKIGGVNEPAGSTDLAKPLLEVLLEKPDSVFILTDGYENAAAGRVAEVIGHLRKMGNDTPIYQLTPTMSAKSWGTRALSPDITVMPVGQKIEGLGLGMLKLMLEQDFVHGVQALLGMTMPKLIGAGND